MVPTRGAVVGRGRALDEAVLQRGRRRGGGGGGVSLVKRSRPRGRAKTAPQRLFQGVASRLAKVCDNPYYVRRPGIRTYARAPARAGVEQMALLSPAPIRPFPVRELRLSTTHPDR
jgi:hypothetical protein